MNNCRKTALISRVDTFLHFCENVDHAANEASHYVLMVVDHPPRKNESLAKEYVLLVNTSIYFHPENQEKYISVYRIHWSFFHSSTFDECCHDTDDFPSPTSWLCGLCCFGDDFVSLMSYYVAFDEYVALSVLSLFVSLVNAFASYTYISLALVTHSCRSLLRGMIILNRMSGKSCLSCDSWSLRPNTFSFPFQRKEGNLFIFFRWHKKCIISTTRFAVVNVMDNITHDTKGNKEQQQIPVESVCGNYTFSLTYDDEELESTII
jgi:hypothetical protein